jgi:hypothetical protein
MATRREEALWWASFGPQWIEDMGVGEEDIADYYTYYEDSDDSDGACRGDRDGAEAHEFGPAAETQGGTEVGCGGSDDRMGGNPPAAVVEGDDDDRSTTLGITRDRVGDAYVRQCRRRSLSHSPVSAGEEDAAGREVVLGAETQSENEAGENVRAADVDERALSTNGGRWRRIFCRCVRPCLMCVCRCAAMRSVWERTTVTLLT